jgi:hypothetical protein
MDDAIRATWYCSWWKKEKSLSGVILSNDTKHGKLNDLVLQIYLTHEAVT